MRNSIIVANSLFKRSLKKKYALFLYLTLPIIGIILPLIISGKSDGKETKVNIAIVDLDNSNVSKNICDVLEKKYNFNTRLLDYDGAKKYMVNNKIVASLIIPKDFKQNLIKSIDTNIEIMFIKNNSDIEWIKQLINSHIGNLNIIAKSANGNESIFDEIYNKFISESTIIEDYNIGENKNTLSYSALGFIMMFMILIITSSFSTIVEDKNKNVYLRILRSNITEKEYIIGHILWNSCICIMQSILIIFFIKLLSIDIGITLTQFLSILMLISVMSISMAMITISFCKKEDQLSIINTIIVFPTCMLSGCLWPIEIMSNTLQNISYVFPQRYIFLILEQFQQEVNINKLILNIILFMIISGSIFTIGIINMNRKALV